MGNRGGQTHLKSTLQRRSRRDRESICSRAVCAAGARKEEVARVHYDRICGILMRSSRECNRGCSEQRRGLQ